MTTVRSFSDCYEPTGDCWGGAKLTEDQVQEMRALRKAEGLSFRELGRRFGLSTMAAYRAAMGQTYTEVA